jgi:hypothetical protein
MAKAWKTITKGAKMMVDRFHLPNHVSAWCQDNMTAAQYPEMKQVNTEVCEQFFKRLARCAAALNILQPSHG